MPYNRDTHTFQIPWEFPPAYREGDFFLGGGPDGHVGYRAEKHGFTVAGPRSGKGVCVIIPNLLRWPHNVLCIDPKGENVAATWERREALGKSVRVLDPFRVTLDLGVPERLLGAFNPFDLLDPESDRIVEDIRIIADGLVKRSDRRNEHWDNGGVSILAGIIAHVLTRAPEDRRNLVEVYRVMNLSGGSDDLLQNAWDAFLDGMEENDSCGGLPMAAAARIRKTGKEGASFLSNALGNIEWLNSLGMGRVLSESNFNLKELKTGQTDLFLVLPADLLEVHSRFLRLFVRTSLSVMARHKGGKCLFLLDEFYALGEIREIRVACGLMPGYGLHLWPILHDIGQLEGLYGKDGVTSFLASADVQMFFGMTDYETPAMVSRKIGNITHDDLEVKPALTNHPGGYPIPPDPVNHPIPPGPYFDSQLFSIANRANTPPQIPHFQSHKSPGGAFMANLLVQGVAAGFHAISVEESNRARAALMHIEKTQRAVHEINLTISQNEERRRRGTYEQHKAMFEDQELKRKIDLENERAIVSHGVSMVGRPRVPPDLVAVGTAKLTEGGVADMAVVFLPEGPRVFKPVPYFDDYVDEMEAERKARLLPVVYRDPKSEREQTIHAHPGLTVGEIHPYTGRKKLYAQGTPPPPDLTLPEVRRKLEQLTRNLVIDRYVYFYYDFGEGFAAYAGYNGLFACQIGVWYSKDGVQCVEPSMPGACQITGISADGFRPYPEEPWQPWQKKAFLMDRIQWFAEAMDIIIRTYDNQRNPFTPELSAALRHYRYMTDERYPLRVRFHHWDRSEIEEQMRPVWLDTWMQWDA